MRCSRCSRTTVWHAPALCAEHFSARFEEKVQATIREHRLIRKRDKVAVACSGGKDSTALLFVLKRLGYDVAALAVDEGIAGYRDRTLRDLTSFTKNHNIPLRIISFKGAYGKDLDGILAKGKFRPCTVCGTFRRQLLNRVARGFDVLATGHNADDESQAVLMNLARANTGLFARIGPATTSAPRAERSSGFVRKVKPLYCCTEKECLTYALLHGLATAWNECPYAPQAYRNDARAVLLAYEARHPGARERVLRHFLKVKKGVFPRKTRAVPCASCGEPSTSGLCKACRLAASL